MAGASFAEGSAGAGSARGWRSGEGTSSWTTELVDIPEKCCFKCKEDGDPLIACDFKNCPKLYHPICVGIEDDDPGKQFICEWHLCVNCKESNSDYHCLCCRISVCHGCLYKVEFIEFGIRQKGLCICCLNQAILTEKYDDSNPHEARSDESNTDDINKILFKNYWENVKVREHLTLVFLEEARVILNKRHGIRENTQRFPDEDHMLDANMIAENAAIDTKGKQNKVNTPLKKNKSNKKTYSGWCSEELMHLLKSFGKDTSKSIDKFEIVQVIKEHIKQNNLFMDNKKKSFLCDDKLQALFRRRKVSCRSMPRLLAVHLAADAVSEDESFDGSEDDGDGAPIITRKANNCLQLNTAKRVSESDKRRFACLNENNLKLIYLRRSLVTDFLNQRDTFERKVVGCFVRIRNSLKGHVYAITKKQYQLGLVTGIRESSQEYKIKDDTCTNILLCVTGMREGVKISTLSEEDLLQEECNDLAALVEKGLLKRPTIAAFKEKLEIVHTDIVNHWIGFELARLERRMDIAHLNGRLGEFGKLLHQKNLLSTDAERKRLLEEVPEIVPEHEGNETELQIAASNYSQENRGKVRDDRASCFFDMVEHSKDTTSDGSMSPSIVEDVTESLRGNLQKPNEAGEAPHHYVKTHHDAQHSQIHNNQDGSPTGAVDIDKDEGKHCRHNNDTTITEEVTNLDSDEDEDQHTVQYKLEDGGSSEAMDTDKDETKNSRHKNRAAWSNEVTNRNSEEEDENTHIVQYKPEGMASQDLTAMNSDVTAPTADAVEDNGNGGKSKKAKADQGQEWMTRPKRTPKPNPRYTGPNWVLQLSNKRGTRNNDN